MARIRKWQQTLTLASVALFLSLAQVWPLRARDAADHDRAVFSRVVTRTGQTSAVGLEFLPQKPFLRMIRASTVPIELPLAAGAFLAMAGSPGSAAPDAAGTAQAGQAAPDAGSSCPVCNTATASCCTDNNRACCNPNCLSDGCWTVVCSNFEPGCQSLCQTCGESTCEERCAECG